MSDVDSASDASREISLSAVAAHDLAFDAIGKADISEVSTLIGNHKEVTFHENHG